MQGFLSYEFPYELPVFETRYDMSSLDPNEVSASQFQDLILRHWGVENCLHLQKDREYEVNMKRTSMS